MTEPDPPQHEAGTLDTAAVDTSTDTIGAAAAAAAAAPSSHKASLFAGLHMSQQAREADNIKTPKLSNSKKYKANSNSNSSTATTTTTTTFGELQRAASPKGGLPPPPLESNSPVTATSSVRSENADPPTLTPAPAPPLQEELELERHHPVGAGPVAAPVTDELLGMLGTDTTLESAEVQTPNDPNVPAEGTATVEMEHAEQDPAAEQDADPPADADAAADPPAASSYSMFGGWFGSSSKTKVPVPATEPESTAETSNEPAADANADTTDAPDATTAEPVLDEAPPSTENGDAAADTAAAAAPSQDATTEQPLFPPKKEMDPQEKRHLDEAFAHSEETVSAETNAAKPRARPRPRGLGEIHTDTPVPNSDVALTLLRQFAHKTRPKIVTTYGGSKSRSILGYLFGSSKEDPNFTPFRDLMDILFEEGEDRDIKDDSGRVVDAVLGETGDSMAKARLALAAFVYLFSCWGHASSRFFEQKDGKTQLAFSELLSASFDSASLLVAHGCLDGVLLGMGDVQVEYSPAVHMLAQSVFNSDLTIERNELAAMKFLLSTGCRTAVDGSSMLHGSHLLQAIRVLYHVYLTTEFSPNKTTARAALQQLVTSVFSRVVKTDQDDEFERTPDNFPSHNHRDAFLVMRSICKLSMRNLPDPNSGMHSHVGLNTSGSNDMWDGEKDGLAKSARGEMKARSEMNQEEEEHHEHAYLVSTGAIHPALESKILALELLLYVLHNVNFSRGFIHRSGSQFHAAIRNYLCVSLLKNCTSANTRVVELSLRIFVPLVRNFRTVLKTEIEAFVTNVFFVILDSKNSPVEHKCIVVKTFDEICSDPATLAEIFLNYDCDLSAVDLFHRIVNTLSRVSRAGMQEPKSGGMGFMGGASAARSEKFRNENRDLRLYAMRALRQVLASLHASIVEPISPDSVAAQPATPKGQTIVKSSEGGEEETGAHVDTADGSGGGQQNLVEVYSSKKKRRAEEAEVILRFNQKPSAGLKYAVTCQHVDGDDPVDVARYLLKNKDSFEKTQIGECLGREAQYQAGFALKVLHEYVSLLDFSGLQFDDAIRFFLSGFRLPGEAQKIDRIMEKFAERYTEQNPAVFPSADVAFILAFSIIMLNTDLHNPAIKEDRRMTKEGFVRNNRGICDGQDLPEELLISIFDRIKKYPISLKEDDDARERAGDSKGANSNGLPSALSPASFFASHFEDMDRARESNFQKERDHIVRTTESLLGRRRHGSMDQGKPTSKSRFGKTTRHSSKFVRTEDSGLRDEYVSPMFDVAWGASLAAFSTAIESANGTVGSLVSVASDEELELAAENAAETIEVCLTGFRFAIATAGLCGNETARDAYMLALGRFSQLGTGVFLEPRHVRCIQTLLSTAREDGELLGSSWEHIFKALSEINRFHQLFQLMARNDRTAASAAARRRRRLEEKEKKRKQRIAQKAAAEDGESVGSLNDDDGVSDTDDSLAESDIFSDEDFDVDQEDMDARAIDEANARTVYDAVSEVVIEGIYERSSSLSAPAVKDFILQLCLVSRMEISVGGHGTYGVGTDKSNLTHVSYRQQHALLGSYSGNGGNHAGDQFHHSQPNIYNLQKLVEVMHYNMHSRPRMIFADLWTIVAVHLTGTALHVNPAIAMYAVDSFRQLSIQYLQRDEVFEFQRRFLKPLETVMEKSDQVTTKELLLNCIDRIMAVCRTESTELDREAGVKQKGGLQSGWVPILSILGFGGRDADLGISRQSFKILSGEVKECLEDSSKVGVLLSEYFIETVNALLMFVNGPHEEVCLYAIDELVALAKYLADDSFAPPQLKRRATLSSNGVSPSPDDADGKQHLELWWPILLGLSQSVGDERISVRSKGLDALVGIIDNHFFPSGDSPSVALGEDEVQTLQLVFRGILTPLLEFAETDGQVPRLPVDFERFLKLPKTPKSNGEVAVEETMCTGWLETTFDHFMDACISICLRSVRTFGDAALVEEIFAILNNCLLSDSGALAVRGLWRLEQFVTSDLDSNIVTDDVWVTVSHMLRRCLTLRGLPSQSKPAPAADSAEGPTEEQKAHAEAYVEESREFVLEDNMFSDRRYVGSNATEIVGLLLTSDRFSETIGLRWRLFLIGGLGRAIQDWEQAAAILEDQKVKAAPSFFSPPDYRETSLFARKWMNRFILQLVSMQDVVQAPSDADTKTNRFAVAQILVADETQRLLSGFLKKEKDASQYRHTETDEALHTRFLALVTELLTGYNNMDLDHLKEMAWLSPVLLGSCIQSQNAEIRLAVQKLVQRLTAVPTVPYPAPPSPVVPEKIAEGPTSSPDGATNVTTGTSLETPTKAGSTDVLVAVPEGEPSDVAPTGDAKKDADAATPEAESWFGWLGGSSPTKSNAVESSNTETPDAMQAAESKDEEAGSTLETSDSLQADEVSVGTDELEVEVDEPEPVFETNDSTLDTEADEPEEETEEVEGAVLNLPEVEEEPAKEEPTPVAVTADL